MKVYVWSRDIAPLILDLGTRWRLVISFTHKLLFSHARVPGSTE
jgi:hypothetical protein